MQRIAKDAYRTEMKWLREEMEKMRNDIKEKTNTKEAQS